MLCSFATKVRDVKGTNDEEFKKEVNLALRHQIICALKCAEKLHKIDASVRKVGDVVLSLHVGVGAGKARFVFVGGMYQRWEYLMTDLEKNAGPIYQVMRERERARTKKIYKK